MPPEIERLTRLGRSFGLTLSDALSDVVVRGEGVRETLHALERQILDLATRKLITAPFDALLEVFRNWLPIAQSRDVKDDLAVPV